MVHNRVVIGSQMHVCGAMQWSTLLANLTLQFLIGFTSVYQTFNSSWTFRYIVRCGLGLFIQKLFGFNAEKIDKVPIHLRSIRAISTVESMELGLTTSHGISSPPQVLSPKYDMDAYMATHFGGDAQDVWWHLGWAKVRPET